MVAAPRRGEPERLGTRALRGLKREFDLDEDTLEELVEELVDAQQVAAREGKILSWLGPAAEPEAQPMDDGAR